MKKRMKFENALNDRSELSCIDCAVGQIVYHGAGAYADCPAMLVEVPILSGMNFADGKMRANAPASCKSREVR